ncbi:MAG: hypothetical protein JKX83_06275 [Pseudomonadales bacterium]|nr:hypothetical protein [Pseudomonadales bacterium]
MSDKKEAPKGTKLKISKQAKALLSIIVLCLLAGGIFIIHAKNKLSADLIRIASDKEQEYGKSKTF